MEILCERLVILVLDLKTNTANNKEQIVKGVQCRAGASLARQLYRCE
jgi:hypothetical protein